MPTLLRSAGFALISVFACTLALAQGVYALNLPAQSLADSLRAIGRQTAMNILFDPATVEHVTAPALHGRFSAAHAVLKVLAGTGLTAQQTSADTWLIYPAPLVEKPMPVSTLPAAPPEAPAAPDARASGGAPLEEVTVTGSLIPQLKTDTAAPALTLSAVEIENQGFRNVYEALRTLPIANGSVQDAQFTGGFTPGAASISLFGLDPSFTLTLLNGRPLADYPMPFNGSSDITNLGNVPLGLIDHIDVLTGAASSIYGSSALAGVINIVLKEKVEASALTFRAGGYSQGGGDNQRVQLASGFTRERLDVVYGLELTHQSKMRQREIEGLDTLRSSEANSRTFLVVARGAGYVDPGAAACEPLGALYGGQVTYSFRPANGFYCGTAATGYNSILSADRQLNGLLTANYHLTDDTTAYMQLLYGRSEPTYSNGLPSWSTSRVTGNLSGYIWNQDTQRAELLQRIYSPEEIGDWHNQSQHVHTHALNGSLGLKGRLFDSGFRYDAYFHYSQENTHYVSFNASFVNQLATAYYLGPRLGTTDEGYPIFSPNLARLYTPITPEQYESFTGARSEYSVSWTEDLTAVLSHGSLFTLPAGDVGVALIAQRGQDEVHAPLDPNAAAGVFDGSNARPNSAGSREHYAFGAEARVPIFRRLSASVSGRYDRYDYHAGTGFGGANGSGKFTYRGGLELRPREDVLVRASYATAFRTPDLYYLFEGPTGSFSDRTDWYQCRLAGYTARNIEDCALASGISPLTLSEGSTSLQNITAQSYTYGVVWSPLDSRLRLAVDYSRVDVRNKVQQIDVDRLLQQEADCRLGVSEGGQSFDIDSPTCRDALRVIERQAPIGALDPLSVTLIHSVPTNIALEHQAGLQTQARYSWGTERFGDFSLDAHYFRQLQHRSQNFPGDAPLDLLCCANNDEFFNTTALDAVWSFGKFSTVLHGTRYAPTWADEGSARNVGPWTVFNASERYDFTRGLFAQLIVNNLADKRPPADPTNNSYPYYSTFSYNGYGRAYWLEFGVKFGGTGGE